MHTPFILSNRSVFPTTYNIHDTASVDGAFTVMRSSQGNDAISEANYEMVGDDVEADLILFWVNIVPQEDGKTNRIRFCMHANLGGYIPQKMREVIASKQATFIDQIENYITKNE